MNGLEAQLRVERVGFAMHLDLAVRPGEVVALLGPNGAGKTTALRALAGLQPLLGGRITLDGQALDGLPPERRRVALVPQDALLLPHLSARDNVAYGLRARGMPKRAARERAVQWLDRVGLGDRAGARPRELSGGQAQRVALARALVTDPLLLLLDEPLAALDAATRQVVRADLQRHLGDFRGPTVLVTHDALDAMVLADRLVVVEHGCMVQEGRPARVAREPHTDYVARLVGLNLHRGIAAAGVVELDGGGRFVTADPAHGAVLVAYAPSAVGLHRRRPEGSARNAWPGRVSGLEQHGTTTRVHLDGAPAVLADVTAAAVAELNIAVGEPLWASVKATEVAVYPA